MDYKNIKAIAFDIDGTLYSSETIISKSYQLSLQELKKKFQLHFPIPSTQDIIKNIGLPSVFFFQALVPADVFGYYDEFNTLNYGYMAQAVKSHQGELMEGVPELLKYLYSQKIVSCMASNGSLRYLNNIMETYHLAFYKPIISLNDTKIQTKTDILAEYLSILDISPSEMIMVGDRYMDLEAAKNNNIFFIGLKSGIGHMLNPKELEDADLNLDNVLALLQFLKNKRELSL